MGDINDYISWLHDRERSSISRFMAEVGIVDTIMYEYRCDDTVVIYTKRPGIWIGYHGKDIDRFKEILYEDWHINFEIKFEEIKDNKQFFSNKLQY